MDFDELKESKVMYILVNKDLRMRPGKVSSQVAHAACKVVRDCEVAIHTSTSFEVHLLDYVEWVNQGETKIVLQASQEELVAFSREENVFPVIDSGATTQVRSGSLTAIGFYPCNAEDERFQDFKLYN